MKPIAVVTVLSPAVFFMLSSAIAQTAPNRGQTTKEGLHLFTERAEIIAQGIVVALSAKRADPLANKRQIASGRVPEVIDIVFRLTDVHKGTLKPGDKVGFVRTVLQENNPTSDALGISATWFQPGQRFLLFLATSDPQNPRNDAVPPQGAIRYEPLVIPTGLGPTNFGVMEIINGRAATNARLEAADQRWPIPEILFEVNSHLQGMGSGHPIGNPRRNSVLGSFQIVP